MTETTLTKDERLRLQLWLRQALAKLETEETAARFIQNRRILEGETESHRESVSRRRSPRTTVTARPRECVN
jgi:hypothetical protein